MNPAIVIGAVVVLFLLLHRRSGSIIGNYGVNVPPQILASAEPTVIRQEQQEAQGANAAANAANAIPVVGPAVSQGLKKLFGFLLGASQARAKEAISENTAVNKAVGLFDQGVKEVVDAANNGQISAQEALGYCDSIWQLYWTTVGAHIQPGRNGCNTGSNCSAVTMGCPGSSIGAACCVGCDEIRQSLNNLRAMFQKGGSARIYQVIASAKYGTAARAGYTVTYTPRTTVSSLLNFL